MDINILVLDTQAYSNTGGQASSATFLGQNAKMSVHGKSIPGKIDRRKELGLLAMNHPDVFVAQVSPSHYNHFFKAILAALTSRAFPLYVYDPRKGETYSERLDLSTNPSPDQDWHTDSKTNELQDFVWFARSE